MVDKTKLFTLQLLVCDGNLYRHYFRKRMHAYLCIAPEYAENIRTISAGSLYDTRFVFTFMKTNKIKLDVRYVFLQQNKILITDLSFYLNKKLYMFSIYRRILIYQNKM